MRRFCATQDAPRWARLHTGSERDDSTALTRTYAYDPIGNRTAATQNEAPNADTITYVRNALNQYKQVAAAGPGSTLKQGLSYDEDGNLVERFIAGDMDCDGDVDMDDIDPFVVALEGQAAYETACPDCTWLHGDINGDGVVDFDDLDVFVNLLSSGNAALWVAYAWDAENRLVGVAPGGTPKSGDLKLAFVYDYMGRRVQKKVWTWDPQAGQGGAWVLTGHRKFVWNGWLLLMELDGLNDDAVLRKRTWGLDLSGLTGGASSAGLASSRSMLEGAGGIGGLLAVYDTNGTTTGENPEADDMAYVYFYDANGNVGQLVDLSHTPGDPAGAIVARYEYDPYGNVTSQSGDYASANPFRFSTKYWDDETGLGYWGYRYYDPKLGRWVSRDPIGERGFAATRHVFDQSPSSLPQFHRRVVTGDTNGCGPRGCATPGHLRRPRLGGILTDRWNPYRAMGNASIAYIDARGLACIPGAVRAGVPYGATCGVCGHKQCRACSYCVCGRTYVTYARPCGPCVGFWAAIAPVAPACGPAPAQPSKECCNFMSNPTYQNCMDCCLTVVGPPFPLYWHLFESECLSGCNMFP